MDFWNMDSTRLTVDEVKKSCLLRIGSGCMFFPWILRGMQMQKINHLNKCAMITSCLPIMWHFCFISTSENDTWKDLIEGKEFCFLCPSDFMSSSRGPHLTALSYRWTLFRFGDPIFSHLLKLRLDLCIIYKLYRSWNLREMNHVRWVSEESNKFAIPLSRVKGF